ncbi:MAG: hypothetical protein HQ481_20360 [Alphaproteobacteria bacterium]|nr:hypothetical protein [Alphaproteobacteria bacterium]
MSRLDETLRPVAARLIARNGTALTLRRADAPIYDPATGVVTESVTDIALSGVVEEVDISHPDGLVQRGDRIITLAAEPLGDGDPTLDPAPGDTIVLSGTEHRVLSVSATYAGDRPALFRLQVRR